MAEQPTAVPSPSPAAEPATGPAAPGRPRVVAICLVPARRGQAITYLSQVAAAGGSALLVTADNSRPSLPDGVAHLDLAAAEQRVGVHALISRSPVRLAARLAGRKVSGASRAWRLWSGSRPYRAVRPWVLWRALRRHLDAVRVAEVDHVIIVSIESWPATWQLHRLNRSITYGWDVPDEVFARVGRPRVPAA